MEVERAVALLRNRVAEIERLRFFIDEPFIEWEVKTHRTLARALGDDHELVERFDMISFRSRPEMGLVESVRIFREARTEAIGVLRAAIYEVRVLAQGIERVTAGGLDAELLTHVSHLIEQEQWAQVASQACVFTEDRIRSWAGRPETEYGERLMTVVFGDNGEFRLGKTPAEQHGWYQFALGFAKAVRNPAVHHVPQRQDLEQYSLGVLGTASLLLTQLRYEHGNRFKG